MTNDLAPPKFQAPSSYKSDSVVFVILVLVASFTILIICGQIIESLSIVGHDKLDSVLIAVEVLIALVAASAAAILAVLNRVLAAVWNRPQ